MTDSPRGIPVKETIKIRGVRKVMARTMKASTDNAALSQVSREIDVTALQELRKNELADQEPRVTLNTFIMTAVARTLPAHPMLNAEMVENNVLIYDTVNMGMAVATNDGLVVVVIPKADALSVQDMGKAIDGLAERARNGNLAMEDVEGGTFTASNLGMYGVDGGFPIPRAPEGAILLIGAARAKPAVFEDAIAIRQIAMFNITFDHRFIDGATAAEFLKDLNELIASPASLIQTT